MCEEPTVVRDAEFIARAGRDAATFTQLYERHYEGVFRYCVHRLFDRTAAEDTTSAVFLKVVENLPRFRGDEQAFRYWLYRIATNTICSHWRHQQKRKKVLQDLVEQAKTGWGEGENDEPEDDQKMALFQQAMKKLKPQYQTIITLHFLENMKLTDIAGILDCSAGTARSRCRRALGKLRKHMAAAMKNTSPEVK